MLLMPDSPGKWETFSLAPVSKTVKVHIAFDGPVTDEAIKKAMRILELALDWAPPEKGSGITGSLAEDPAELPLAIGETGAGEDGA